MQELTLFDFLPDHEAEKYRPQKSTDWKWSFKDYPKEKNGLTVFSCFACGGGSTMGYKLAGCEVIGCCEIDPKMNAAYIKNHNPRHNFLMDIREFNKIPNNELPPELFDLDILDGSPPCTTFSTAGQREESWGKKKKFREGQAEQTLDDLSFVFIETVAKLRPKCVIMENVEGLLLGEAWKYVQDIYKQFKSAGYSVKHWLLKGEQMGIPQQRHRVFFVAILDTLHFDLDRLDMSFHYDPVPFEVIRDGKGRKPTDFQKMLLDNAVYPDRNLEDIRKRIDGRAVGFTDFLIWPDKILQTVTATGKCFSAADKVHISDTEIIHSQTFPEDYDFAGEKVRYICGMSVPPIMIKRIVTRLIESGVFSYKGVAAP